jgi:ubiquinone/menaquinone biosynthesis C-methylase UbiE
MLQSLRHRILNLLEAVHLLMPVRAIYNWFRYILNIPVLLKNLHFRMNGSPDGLPLQPPRLIHYVSGVYDREAFYHNGKQGAECIKKNLEKNYCSITQFRNVLDFGCGCGRVMRHWSNVTGPQFYGSDYNPLLIDWCNQHLPFARFSVNELAPPLKFDDGKFDFLYAISVFTHLTLPLQQAWMNELRRVLTPGGYCMITLLGKRQLGRMTPEEQREFLAGNLVVQHTKVPGTNTCLAFHPESYFRKNLTEGFEVVDYIPGGAEDASYQDVFLLKKL